MSKKLSPFDFVTAINSSKKDLMADAPENEKAYLPFIINRQMSYFQDTVLLANEMNASSKLQPQLQFDFYRHTVRPRKRFSKWIKPEEIDDLNTVAQYYNINKEQAKQALKILDSSTIDAMRKAMMRGGLSKDK
jgi:hypothetical protein